MFSRPQSSDCVSDCISENIHQVVTDLNKEKRETFFDVVVVDLDHEDRPTGDNLQEKIFGWLSAPDPWKNHHTACKSRHRGTADWFIQGNVFLDWRTSEVPSSLLWVHGKRLLIPGFCGSTGTKMFLFSVLQREPEKVSFGA